MEIHQRPSFTLIPRTQRRRLWSSFLGFEFLLLCPYWKIALFSASTNGRNVLYLVNLNGGSQPEMRVLSCLYTRFELYPLREKKSDDKPAILRYPLSSLIQEEFAILKGAPTVMADGVRTIISLPQLITLKIPPNDSLFL